MTDSVRHRHNYVFFFFVQAPPPFLLLYIVFMKWKKYVSSAIHRRRAAEILNFVGCTGRPLILYYLPRCTYIRILGSSLVTESLKVSGSKTGSWKRRHGVILQFPQIPDMSSIVPGYITPRSKNDF